MSHFTPDLISFYTKFKSSQRGDMFEVVFVSSDEDEENFTSYLSEMPWLALPFSDKDRKGKLSKRFRVQGIPMLVLINGLTGTLITTTGRECVTDDPEGEEFPWYPKSFSQMIQGSLLRQKEMLHSDEALKGKIKGIYFSALWCPPCRLFTDELKKVYDKVTSEGKQFEVIYASSDRTEDSYTQYQQDMPWLALPYNDSRVAQLTRSFDVDGIPTLILLDENDVILNKQGRRAVSHDPTAQNYPWPTAAAEELSEDTAPLLNESPCLILFTDDKNIDSASSLLSTVAAEYKTQMKSNQALPELCFLFEGPTSKNVAESVRSFAHLDSRGSHLAILNVPDEHLYVDITQSDITEESIRKLVEDFKNDRLVFQKFSES